MLEIESDLISLATAIGQALQQQRLMLATAESCTGGWVSQVITSIPGSSQWFERGFITYSDQAKQELLGVQRSTLETYGAVSEQTAKEMAEGALHYSQAQVSLAVTGIAGPDGGSAEKPVGLVWFGFARENFLTVAMKKIFTGDRQHVRAQAVEFVLKELLTLLK